MKTTLKQKLTTSFLLLVLSSSPAWSQTAFQQPLPPVPESKVKQTKDHFEGNFGSMNRRKLQGGEIQNAWDDAATDGLEGVWNYERCNDCTFKVRLRQHMISVINLPMGEKITAVDVGDADNFKIKVRDTNTLAVKPLGFGGDTNLIIYGEEGRIYAFYLRAEGVNSKNITDFIINVKGEIPEDIIIPTDKDAKGALKKASALPEGAISDLIPNEVLKTDENDFVKHVPFDPDKLHGWGDYKLSGDKDLEPDTVFRDEHFTYIKYSKKKWNQLELPTAYTVIDTIDELVNTHVVGTTYVIESTAKLISLKSGTKFLCIRYEGADL